MRLYGILLVTTSPVSGTPGTAYFGSTVVPTSMGSTSNRHFSQLGRRGMKFVEFESCAIVLWGAVVWLIGFLVF